MNKKAGFTLAELLVSMAIFVIIIGAIAALFGTSLKAMVYGKAQEVAYAEASLVMNDSEDNIALCG
jgi:prepilin-type N-terminal cleavage/methylation domain-containing protein